jgi:hypothetical protein
VDQTFLFPSQHHITRWNSATDNFRSAVCPRHHIVEDKNHTRMTEGEVKPFRVLFETAHQRTEDENKAAMCEPSSGTRPSIPHPVRISAVIPTIDRIEARVKLSRGGACACFGELMLRR